MAMRDDPGTVMLQVSGSELQLIRTALQVLLSTLGKEEAEEIDEIQAILARLEASFG